MKKLSGLVILLFCAFISYGQIPNSATISNAQTKYQIPNMFATLSAKLPVIDTLNNRATPYPGALTILPDDTLNKSVIPPIYISNGVFWGKLAGGGGVGVDSVTFPETPNRQICIWSGGFSQCYAIGGYYDSTSYNNDSTYYYHFSNGSFVDSVWIPFTKIFVRATVGVTDTTHNGRPAVILSAQDHYVTPDSLYYVTLNPDGSIKDSTQWTGLSIAIDSGRTLVTLTTTTLQSAIRYGRVTAIVTDVLRGGSFNFSPEALTDDNGTIFPASGGGHWVRDMSQADGFHATWFDVKTDGTDGATGINATIVAADIAGGGKVILPNGVIKANSEIVLYNGVYLTGGGKGATTLDMTASTAPSAHIYALGTLTALPSLGKNVLRGDSSIVLASDPDLEEGDVIILHDTTNFSYSLARFYYEKGEFYTVRSVTGDSVAVTNNSFDSYTVGPNILIYKMNPATFGVSGMTINFKRNTLVVGLLATLGVGCNFSDLHLSGSQNANLKLDRCYNTQINNVSVFDNNTAIGYNYGIAVSNCQRVTISDCSLEATRHGITVGGQDYIGTVVNREISVFDSYVNSLTTEPGMDLHGNTEETLVQGCDVPSGLVLSGDRQTVIGNRIGNNSAGGQGIAITEQLGKDFTIIDNIFTANQNYAFIIREIYSKYTTRPKGVLEISGNTFRLNNFHGLTYPTTPSYVIYISTVDTAATEDMQIVIKDNTIHTTDTIAGTYNGIYVKPTELRAFENVIIDNNIMFGCAIETYANMKTLTVSNNKIYNANGLGWQHIDYYPEQLADTSKTIIIDDNIVMNAKRSGIFLNQNWLGKRYSRIYITNNKLINNGKQSDQSEFSLWVRGAKDLYLNNNTFGHDSTTSFPNVFTYRLDSVTNLHESNNSNIGYGYNTNAPLFASVENDRFVNVHKDVSIGWGTAAPTTGPHNKGDIIYNTNPTSSTNAAWICTTSGTPGTWVVFGDLSLTNLLSYKAVIPTATDLGIYQTTGIYEQTSNASASAGTNYPIAYAGELTVFQSHPDFTYQQYHSYNGSGLFYRGRYQSTWSAWKTILPTTGATYTTTTGNGLDINSSTVTTGNLVSIGLTGTAATSNTKTGLSVTSSGANGTASQTITGLKSIVTNTGTTGTNVAGVFSASGATNNYAGLFTGKVGIGTATPGYDLEVYNNVDAPYQHLIVNNPNAGVSAQTRIQLFNNGGTGVSRGGAMFLMSSNFASPYANSFGVWNYENGPILFATNATERLRISSGGNTLLGLTTDDGVNKLQVTGHLKVNLTGKVKIATGTNASAGTTTLVAGTVTISTTAIATGDNVILTVITPAGTQGFLSAPSASIVNGTSFVINSSSATETSTVYWEIRGH